MPIRADILSQLADALAELYPDQGSIRALATRAGLALGQISFDPKASNTWPSVLNEAEAHNQTQSLLNQTKSQYPDHKSLALACQTYTDWVTTGRSTASPLYTQAGTLRAPPPPNSFAGRTIELQELTEVLLRNQAAPINAAVSGMGGVGKTTLARKLASDLAPHFPGGVVWLEAGHRASQSDLVDRLARTLDVDVANEPLVEERAGILQSVLAGRGRVFVILDDLWDVDLGRWAGKQLLPTDRVLLVTSRDVALCRALRNYVQRLDVLPEAEALELLANLLGPLGRHEGAAKELVKQLDGHPLALEIAACRCDNSIDDLPWLARKLRDNPMLGELKLPGQESRDTSVEASLMLSYGDLDPDLQQCFRALGVFAPAPFDLNALAAVWNAGLERQDSKPIQQLMRRVKAALTSSQGSEIEHDLRDVARQLTRRGLLSLDSSNSDDNPVYRQHTLLGAYAWALLEQAGELKATTARYIAYYQALPGRQAENWQVAENFWDQINQGWQHALRIGLRPALRYYYALCVFLDLRSRHAAHIEWALALLRLPVAQLPAKHRATILNDIGRIFAARGEKQLALTWFEQALSLSRQVNNRTGKARTLNDIGGVYANLGERQQALAYYEQALPLLRQVGDQSGEAATLNNIGGVYANLGEKQQALAYYEQALLLSRQVGDHSGEAQILTNIGGVYADLGDKQQALAYYEQALPLSRQVDDRTEEARTLNNIGLVHSALGEKQQALAYFEQALPLSRQVGDQSGEATTLHNMGMVYFGLGEKQQALVYYEQALPLRRQVGDRAGEAETLNNIGVVHSALGEKQQALAYYEQALPLRRQVGDRSGEAATIYNIGRVYDALGEKQQALAYYEQALPLSRQVGDRSGEAKIIYNIGRVYDALGDKPRALAYFKQALPLSHQVDDRSGEAATLHSIGQVYDALGEKQQALAYYEQALPLFRQADDRTEEARTLNNIGLVYDDLGKKPQALAYFEQALPLFRQVDDRTEEAGTLNNIGLVYDDLGELQQALAYFEQALPLSRQVGDRSDEAAILNNMAHIYFQQGQLDRTVQMLSDAIQVLHQIGAAAEEVALLLKLALVFYQILLQTQEAVDPVTQSIAILQRYQLPRDASHTTLAAHQAFLARLQGSAGDQSEALSLDQLLSLVRQAREGDQGLVEQLTPFLQGLASDAGTPAEVQALATVLLQLLASTDNPDLNDRPADLAEAIRHAFDLPLA